MKDLPPTTDAAFALQDVARSGATMMETLLLKASTAEVLRAAEQALLSVDFESRPHSWTADRRCGEYTLGWHEWPFWACIYVRQRDSGDVHARIIVESWASSGRPPWHLHLATALQTRLRAMGSGDQVVVPAVGTTKTLPAAEITQDSLVGVWRGTLNVPSGTTSNPITKAQVTLTIIEQAGATTWSMVSSGGAINASGTVAKSRQGVVLVGRYTLERKSPVRVTYSLMTAKQDAFEASGVTEDNLVHHLAVTRATE